MSDKNLQKEVLTNTIDKTLRDIIHGDLMMGWYGSMVAKEADKKRKAGFEMKIEQLKTAKELNESFMEFAAQELASL